MNKSGDILDMYAPGPVEGNRATKGGETEFKSIPYSSPVGPKGQMKQGPGLHEDNCGNCGTQGKY